MITTRETSFVSRFFCIVKFFRVFFYIEFCAFYIQFKLSEYCIAKSDSCTGGTMQSVCIYVHIDRWSGALGNRGYTYKSSCSKKLEESEICVKQIFKCEHSWERVHRLCTVYGCDDQSARSAAELHENMV